METVLARMRTLADRPALYWDGGFVTYGDWFEMIDAWSGRLPELGIGRGSICGVHGDYTPGTSSLIFALMEAGAIIVPFTPAVEPEIGNMVRIAGLEHMIRFAPDDAWTCEKLAPQARHGLISEFDGRGRTGLVVFTSGSTGEPKGILHDCERVMRKFVKKRPGRRTVLFLAMDHFGGFNTLLGTFAYGGVGVCLAGRSPLAVCEAIEGARATLLPVTPTFLNLLLASDGWRIRDLESLELITYGTEVMPEQTLAAVADIFPGVKIKQTYGLSEVGVLRSRSEDGGSTWVRVGGDGFETKVVDGILWIRSEANMVGYLNAPNPFGEDGWLNTGDHVEVDGDRMRFMGRESEIINVGGQKVFPVEVEGVLLEADNISEAAVYGVPHPILGAAVAARISTDRTEDPDEIKRRLKDFCAERLTKYKIPMRFVLVDAKEQLSQRFKKIRRAGGGSG